MTIGVSRAPYAAFKTAGDRVGGEILDFRLAQKTDMDSKRPMYFEQNAEGKGTKSFRPYGLEGRPNDPITHWEITVETGIEDEDGDTERRIIIGPRRGVRGTALEGKRGLDAITKALKQAKAHRVGLEIGGKLFMTFLGKVRVGTGPETGTWSAEYEPPVGGVGSGTPVDETPWLVGGGRYDKQTELAKWEASRNAGTAAAAASRAAATPTATGADDDPWATSAAARSTATQGVRDTTVTGSPYDDEPPF
jgi:hypothetical protein